jgi:hypothetical protein
MQRSQVVVICLSLFAGYIAAAALNRPSSAQVSAPQQVEKEGAQTVPFRYQLTAPAGGPFAGYLILTDTATGRCWWRFNNSADWQHWGSPAQRK